MQRQQQKQIFLGLVYPNGERYVIPSHFPPQMKFDKYWGWMAPTITPLVRNPLIGSPEVKKQNKKPSQYEPRPEPTEDTIVGEIQIPEEGASFARANTWSWWKAFVPSRFTNDLEPGTYDCMFKFIVNNRGYFKGKLSVTFLEISKKN